MLRAWVRLILLFAFTGCAIPAALASGPFRWVRNPIFTAMTVAMLGLALLVPTVVSLLALLALVLAFEILVRLVEEPYPLRTHGEQYRRYGADTGRFLPGIGRLTAAPATVA